MIKKALLSFLAIVVLFSAIAPRVAHAQVDPWYNQGIYEWYVKVYDEDSTPPAEIFGERYTAAQVNWIIWSILTWLPNRILNPSLTACILGGLFADALDVGDCIEGLTGSTEVQSPAPLASLQQDRKEQSLLKEVFAERSFSGITYVKNIGRKFNLIPEAKAQGFGFITALDPVQHMWRAVRDIAYAFFVIATIILAFMIMFRVKLSPQTAISVQSALPKLIIALILVTFSYAIAGFLVDLMYVVIGIVSIFGAQVIPGDIFTSTHVFNFLTKGQPFNVDIGLGFVGLFIAYIIAFNIALIISMFAMLGVIGSALSLALVGILSIATGGAFALVLAGIAIIVSIIVFIVLIWMFIRITWILIRAYAHVLLLTIAAPIQLTLGIIVPSLGFGSWLRSFISNLAVFVVVGLLFLLSFIFLLEGVRLTLNQYITGVGEGLISFFFGTGISQLVTGNLPPAGWPPLLFVGQLTGPVTDAFLGLLFLGVSFVIFFMIPRASDIIQSIVERKPIGFGTGIGQAFTPVAAGAGALWGSPTASSLRREFGDTSARDILTSGVLKRYTGPGSGVIGRTRQRFARRTRQLRDVE
jgi:hypothetical protein